MNKKWFNRFLWIVILALAWTPTEAQKVNVTPNTQIKTLNNYVYFINESIHGMLIVHRLLENFNQDINKFADLDGYQINFYSNKDLPKNIFVDEEKWFYEISPYEWHDIAKRQSNIIGSAFSGPLNANSDKLKTIITATNNLRFEIEDLIKTKDLSDNLQLAEVYEKLEQGVALYKEFYRVQLEMERTLKSAYALYKTPEKQFFGYIDGMSKLYSANRTAMSSLRSKNTDHFEDIISNQRRTLNAFKNIDTKTYGSKMSGRKIQNIHNNIIEQAELALKSTIKFFEHGTVPLEYKLYGKFYFYYNSDVINKFNRYGNGIVVELNNALDYLESNNLRFTEMPHYFQVLYPKRLETVDAISASDPVINKLPTKLKEREIRSSNRIMKVDSLEFDVLLFDHMIVDGDTISINYNGDWVLEEIPLIATPQRLRIKLNKEGKNFILLHAVNVGRRPPNTMAMSYYYRGKKQQIILKSDLNTSEMIEIQYIGPR